MNLTGACLNERTGRAVARPAPSTYATLPQCLPGQFGWLAPLWHWLSCGPNFGGWCSAPKAAPTGPATIVVATVAAMINIATRLRIRFLSYILPAYTALLRTSVNLFAASFRDSSSPPSAQLTKTGLVSCEEDSRLRHWLCSPPNVGAHLYESELLSLYP